MSPIHSYMCHDCLFEFDTIVGHDAPAKIDCERCEAKGAARRIPSIPAQSRGSFGTVPKKYPKSIQKMNFTDKKETE